MLSLVGITILLVQSVSSLNNGVGLTPQMGWNSWNKFACSINESLINDIIDAMASTGLQSVGYQYVNLDDCWQSARYTNGTIMPDPDNFPNGIVPLINKAHSIGLKFGVYSDAGNYTCQKRPGSLGYETIDANTYARWGVDYLKYDNCYNDNISPETRYPIMRDALNATGRSIFYSMCEWGEDKPWEWATTVGNSWRTTGDISDNWKSMISNFDKNGNASDAGPGHWNDPDMLEIGNGGLTVTEEITHFSLWCIAKAPLIVGCDIRNMSDTTSSILMNSEAIAINQDRLGQQASKKYSSSDDTWQVYSAMLEVDTGDGPLAVLVLNRGDDSKTVTMDWSMLGIDSNAYYIVRDVNNHKTMGKINNQMEITLESHAVGFYRLYLLSLINFN